MYRLNRPFCRSIDLREVTGMNEVILSLNTAEPHEESSRRPQRRLRSLLVEPRRRYGGAIKFDEPHLDGPVIVFNGDAHRDRLNAV